MINPSLNSTAAAREIPSNVPEKAGLLDHMLARIKEAAAYSFSFLGSITATSPPPSAQETLKLAASEIHKFTSQLSSASNPSSFESGCLAELPRKIKNCMATLLSDELAMQGTSVEKDRAVLSIYEFAKTLKTSPQAAEKLRATLPPKFFMIFDRIVPFPDFPEEKPCLPLLCCRSFHSLPDNAFLGRFGDGAYFHLKKDIELPGFIRFTLPAHPGCLLYQPASTPWKPLPSFQESSDSLPPKIQEVFDTQTIKKKMELPEQFPEIASQLANQLLLLRKAYIEMILHSLGVPVQKPLSIGKRGEWLIFNDEAFKSLKSLPELAGTPELLDNAAKKIRGMLDLELKFQIKLLALPQDCNSSESAHSADFFKVSNETILAGIPLLKIEFLPDPIASRVVEVQNALRTHFPAALVEEVYKRPFQLLPYEQERTFIDFLAGQKIIEIQDLLQLSAPVIALLHAFRCAMAKSAAAIGSLPWKKLQDIESLRTYLLFTASTSCAAEHFSSPEILLEHILCLAKKILSDTPHHRGQGEAREAGPLACLNFDRVVDTLLGDKKTLAALIIQYLLVSYVKESETPFYAYLEKMLSQDSGGLLTLFGKKLDDEKEKDLKSTLWCLGADNTPFEPSQYFALVFWEEFLNSIEEMLNSNIASEETGLKLALLRYGKLLSKGEPSHEAQADAAMIDCLHHHMMKTEQEALVQNLNKKIQKEYNA